MGWALDGPVATPVEDGRRMLYTATGGAEGVGGVDDLKVVPLATPGQGVRVMPGTALMLSRYGSIRNESYQGAVNQERALATTPTQSTPVAGRSDLVVMRVKDPWGVNSPWPEPSDPATYDGFPVEIIEGVPKTARSLRDVPGHQNDTGIALARIDFGPSTGTVNAGMIVNLRKVARPRRETVLRTLALISGDTQTLTSTSAYPDGGQTWPLAAELAWSGIPIPTWATRAKIVMTWAGVLCANNSWGEVWVQVAPTVNPKNVKTQGVAWDAQNAPGNYRTMLMVADEIEIPAALRGTDQVFYPRATRSPSSPPGSSAKLDWGSAISLQVEFMETAD